MQAMQEGQTIKHDVYGLGIVTASDQERTSVDFDDHGPKLFVTSMMTAELIGEAPATPPKTKRRRNHPFVVSRLSNNSPRPVRRRGVCTMRRCTPLWLRPIIPPA